MSFLKFIVKYIYAVCCSIFLFTFGVLWRSNRKLIHRIFSHFRPRKKRLWPERKLPSISYYDLPLVSAPTHVIKPEMEDGNTTLLESLTISKLIQSVQPQNIFELGTFNGRTTLHMAANAPKEAKVYTLDLPQEEFNNTKYDLDQREETYVQKEVSGEHFIGTEYASQITQLFGDSASFDFSSYENTIDFIFIDASHAYDYVVHDSQTALKLLRNGKGVILWHDYTPCWDGVVDALNEFYSNDARCKNLKQIHNTTLAYLHIK